MQEEHLKLMRFGECRAQVEDRQERASSYSTVVQSIVIPLGRVSHIGVECSRSDLIKEFAQRLVEPITHFAATLEQPCVIRESRVFVGNDQLEI